ncbi:MULTISPECIES: RrF2 family transcriptional regulator [Flavobacteriaceae]|uniref:Rrf2 family transcriptional regulator n=2 Tax=Flavobacteriaceae TaxID=49546 RepID=A0A4Y8AQV6_9FLAO|nr:MULTISPECIES: Rrf2 family transcriptional regulator [Flavobacteriaceae]TEW73129.1 Rrf2 family transcriptional regulator [Gramella jeungdoensis]GGK46822.1 Rrf2 family transcriptional regulator [Lutibacter litoralis]
MLSMKTKYGLKALSYLSRQEQNVPVLISDISESESISKKFLESILLTLKKNGILASKKGKGGGYYLLKKPKEIKISTIIRILEGPIAMLPCVSLNYYEKCEDCKSEDQCSLNRLMVEVRDSTLKILENKTLEDFHCGS